MLTRSATERIALATLTWLGHASFRLDTDGGSRLYIDPFLSGPTCPESEKVPDRADAIALTHGHGDHSADAVALQQRLGSTVVGIVELAAWLSAQGVPDDKVIGFNKGGTVEVAGVRITMTHAFHSSSAPDGTYAGEPAGFIVGADGATVYFAGDTNVFGDMALIAELYAPTVAVLPIGDHYTMGPREAAKALELLGNPRCVPCHWGTFPILTGTPDALAALTPAVVERLDARRLDHPVRERWFGATGRRVPEIALDGELELADALVLEAPADPEVLRAAHAEGRPVVVRAATAAEVKAALARPEVACALVADPALLELDLTELTYG